MNIMRKIPMSLTINHEEHELYLNPNRTLLEVLREDLSLTGSKEGCGEGVCGSCTVLCDGLPVRSCLTLAPEVEGAEITTVEGLGMGENNLDPLQQAFIQNGAVQCGFCTPGMLLSARAFLNSHPNPGDQEIKEAISGNICRCTGYAKIIDAIKDAAEQT
jgi:carbon-monoxide dehydrogenase small subunit